MMNWSPFDERYPHPMLPWSAMAWRQRLSAATLLAIMWGIAFPAMLIGGLWLFGSVLDGLATHHGEVDQCRKRAETTYEYHKC